MKKVLSILVISLLSLEIFAGGIVTNTNQSASYVRLLARDASTGLDAVFFNPAALGTLPEGFFLSVNSQTIFQDQSVSNAYPFLNNADYEGKISAPVFPGVYGVYKTGKLAVSFGFNPVGGGGGAEYSTGLPSFEIPVSNLKPMLEASGMTVDGYSADIYFTGTSIFWGAQLGLSYQINDMISVFGGARYIMAKNTYQGHIRDISLFMPGYENGVLAADFFNGMAAQLNTAAAGIQPLIDANLGTLTIPEAQNAGALTPEQAAEMSAGFQSIGLDPAVTPLQVGQGGFTAAAAQFSANAEGVGDIEVDAEQSGTGITPIFGANFSLMDKKLNIGLKYELKTSLELENSTKVDGSGLFPDGAKTHNDMPAFFSAGAKYQVSDNICLHAGYHLYFDKDADYGKTLNGLPATNDEVIESNYSEIAFGLEYKMNDKFLLSLGYLVANSGVTADYQTDMSFSLSSGTIGFGGKYSINENMDLNLGVLYTAYTDGEKTIDYGTFGAYNEMYDKSNLIFAIGLDMKLF